MNVKIFKFTTTTSILLLTIDVIGSSKHARAPDMNPISSRFADLLNSLVKVNVERVDALKKLFTLYDDNGAKHLLRTTQDGKDDSKPDVAMVFDNQDYPETMNKPQIRDKKRLCLCQDAVSEKEDIFVDEFIERDFTRENLDSDSNLRLANDESVKADKVIFLSIDSKQLPIERNDFSSSSQEEEDDFHTPLNSRARPSLKSQGCLSPQRGYEDCKTACKEAYGNACAEYHCSEHLYKQLRKECKHACKRRFKERYDDYDYY